MSEYEKIRYKFSKVIPLLDVNKNSVLEREKQINIFEKELMKYGIFLSDLVSMKINEKTKNELLTIAFFIVNNGELLENFQKEKDIPLDLICKEYIKPKTLVKYWRDYIIAYVILLSNSRYKAIQGYIKVEEVIGLSDESERIESVEESKGLILSKGLITTRILTSNGEFKRIKSLKGTMIGEELQAKTIKSLSEQKGKVIAVLATLIFIIGLFTYHYMNISSTILVKTTSAIILEVNTFNRVQSINSETERGKKLVNSIDVLDRNIDYAILEIAKYANNNDMIPSMGITITVNGNKIKYGDLEETENYLFLENIDVKLNNSGIEQQLK